MEDQKKPGPGLALNQDFAKGGGLEPKVKKFFENVNFGRSVEQTSVTKTYHRWGSGAGMWKR